MNNLYAYAYNELNDVYTIRGISSEEISFEPRVINDVPRNLISKIEHEYVEQRKCDEELDTIISFSKNRFYAIVDFHGRKFDFEQVSKIMNGEKLDLNQSKKI